MDVWIKLKIIMNWNDNNIAVSSFPSKISLDKVGSTYCGKNK